MNKIYKRIRNLGLTTVAVISMTGASIAQCTTEIAPWSYDVESAVATTSSAIADCWASTPANTSSAYRWDVGSSTPSTSTGPNSPYSGSKFFYTEASSGSNGAIAYLETPQIDLTALTVPQLVFYYHMHGSDINTLNIQVSSDNGATWTTESTISGEQQTAQGDAWKEKAVPLTSYSGVISIRFEAIRGASFNGDISLDDISVNQTPTCIKPSDLDTLSTTTTSVELEWLELNTGTLSWNIEYGPSGFTPGTPAGTIVSAPTNPFTVTGLTPSSNYDFYVQSVCTTTDQSAWRGLFSVYTECGIAIAPFYEGFNNAVQPQCWENISSNTTSTSINNLWNFNKQGEYGALNNGRAIGTFVSSDGSIPNPDSMYLITPEIDISQLGSPYLSFEWFSNNTNNPGDNVPFIISVYDGTSWNLLDTLIGDSPDWEFVNYDLSAYSNNIIKVRFMTNQSVPGTAFYNDILLDEVRIDDCVSLGGQDGSIDVCRFDNTVDLNSIIVKPNGGGIWSFPGQPAYVVDDSIFNVAYLPTGSYEVYYVERYVCYDTTIATINVFGASSAGIDGSDTVCKNEPIDLFGALSGNVDTGGEWYDFSNVLLPNSQPKAQPIPGQYNYMYIADNGVCPADTSIVEIGVRSDCDFLSLGEELFTDISVYPNPATSQLNIVNPSNTASLKVEMLDMNGRVVLVENKALNNASEATLAIDHLERGIYTLRVYNNEGQKTFKIVKQ